MADDAAPPEGELTDPSSDDAPPEGAQPEPGKTDPGDTVSRAELKKIRSETASLRRRAKEAESELEKLRTEQLSESEKAIAQARQEARQEALGEANQRVIAAEIRAAAAAAGAIDPDDVVALIDSSGIAVDDDGTVTGTTDAVRALLKAKPHLVRQDEPRFRVPGDGGSQGSSSQLTRDDLQRMSPSAINAARRDGRLDVLLGK